MRIRTVKPEFFSHEDLSALPPETHLLAAGLLCYADDCGYFNANPALIKAAISPLRECSVTAMLAELARIGYIRLGTAGGRRYGQVANFTTHQVVNRPTPSRIESLPIAWDDSLASHGGLMEDSRGKGKEGKGTKSAPGEANASPVRGAKALPPWVPEDLWAAFVEARGISNNERALGQELLQLQKLRAAGRNIREELERSTLTGCSLYSVSMR